MRSLLQPGIKQTQLAAVAKLQPLLAAVQSQLFSRIDIAPLVYFRVAFGAIMFWEVWRYFSHDWIRRYWIEPAFNFTYYGFDWVKPLPGSGMYFLFAGLGILAIFITLGFWYRVSATLFFIGFTYSFLLEQARYLNHFYLVCLLSFLLIFLPADRALSLDALRRPAMTADSVPAWTLWLLRAQIGIVYFYAGIAKLNADWFQGEPLRIWLSERTDFPLIGVWFTEEWMVYLLSYSGLLLDLLVFPLLLWRKTRIPAFLIAVAFHLTNARLFSIGIFPWFMIAVTVLFFSPHRFRKFFDRWLPTKRLGRYKLLPAQPLKPRQRLTLACLSIYLAVQLLVPFRHFLYPGNVNWTYEGHQFSWHMKLLDKDAEAEFLVTDLRNQTTWTVYPEDYLERWQVRKMSTRPDMILQFSHYLADELRQEGYDQVEVRAKVLSSLNGREPQLLIDPEVNLAAEKRTLAHAPWIMPLTEPLRR
jgi:vitamin K-dependent gamma-carboxylase